MTPRMLAPRPGLTSGLTSGQWLSITDIPRLRAVCEDPAVPLFCFDCPWSCKADPRVGYCSKATHHMFCLLQLLSGHCNHAAAAGYSRRAPPTPSPAFLPESMGEARKHGEIDNRPRSSTMSRCRRKSTEDILQEEKGQQGQALSMRESSAEV